MTPILAYQIICGGAVVWTAWFVWKMITTERKHQARMKRWEELGKRASKGDTEAMIELLESGPGGPRYK